MTWYLAFRGAAGLIVILFFVGLWSEWRDKPVVKRDIEVRLWYVLLTGITFALCGALFCVALFALSAATLFALGQF